MHPEVIMQEIEKGMVMAGVSRRFFKFKTLSPLYPTLIDELNAPNYWNKWTFKKSCEQELKEQAQMTFILNEF